MRFPLLVSMLIFAGSFLHLGVPAAAHPRNVKGSALMVLSGSDSRISKLAYLRIASAEEWSKTWLDHLGLKNETIYRPSMEIDFNRCLVVAVFGGKSFNSNGFRVEPVLEHNDKIVVRFDAISYQTEGSDGGADRVTPYAFIVLLKSNKPIVLEKNVQSYIGHSPEWKEVAQLVAAE